MHFTSIYRILMYSLAIFFSSGVTRRWPSLHDWIDQYSNYLVHFCTCTGFEQYLKLQETRTLTRHAFCQYQIINYRSENLSYGLNTHVYQQSKFMLDNDFTMCVKFTHIPETIMILSIQTAGIRRKRQTRREIQSGTKYQCYMSDITTKSN